MRQLIYVEQVNSYRILRLRSFGYGVGVVFCPTGKHFIRAWTDVDKIRVLVGRVNYYNLLKANGCCCFR